MNRLLRLSTFTVLALGLVLLTGSSQAADEAKKDNPHADLIGKTAPDLEGDFALNGKAVKLSDLKGKVVLLDFWAVWCGPCIATFPHLREWNQEYKDKGLEIVGVTSYYEVIGFDKDAGKSKKVDNKLSKVEEQAMLKDFAAHHKLDYRLMTMPKEDLQKVYKEYKVRGIPQVVLIDRKGNVRLVKVGSGEANAKAIATEIKKLIAEQ